MADAAAQQGAITVAAPQLNGDTSTTAAQAQQSSTAAAASVMAGGTATALTTTTEATTATTTTEDAAEVHDDDDADEDHESDDECDWACLQGCTILSELMELEVLLNGNINEAFSYEEFHSRIWGDFRLACRRESEDEETFEALCDESVFELYYEMWVWPSSERLFKRFESSYAKGCKPWRYTQRFTLDYDKCTTKELKRFVKQRRLRDPYPNGITLKYFYIRELETADRGTYLRAVDYETSTAGALKQLIHQRGLHDPYPDGITLKYSYLQILKAADRAQQFDFMGLPAEMRMRVYQYSLAVPLPPCCRICDEGAVCPGMLRTCKTIYKEAKGVLYDENVFYAGFIATAHDNGAVCKAAKVHNQNIATQCIHAKFLSMPDGIDDYPDFFRRIAHLQVDLSYHVHGAGVPNKGAMSLNHFLYTLASFLMDGHCLKSLRLKVDISQAMPESEYTMIFYPLRRLRNVPKLIIEGNVPAFIQKKLQYDVTSSEPVFNTMRYWKFVHDQAMYQMQLGDMMGTGECEACLEYGTSSDLELAWVNVVDKKFHSCLGSHNEEQFIAQLALLQESVQKLDVDKVYEFGTKLVAQRIAMKSYEEVTDDGRPEEALKIWQRQSPLYSPKSLKPLNDVPRNEDWQDE